MTPLLRPLSFGEMLDRAFAVSLRTALPAAAVAVVALALAFGGARLLLFLAVEARLPTPLPALLGGALMFASIVAGIAALLSAQIDAYLGRRVSLRRMLADSLRSWPRMALLFLLYGAVLFVPVAVAVALADGGFWLAQHVHFLSNANGVPGILLIGAPLGLAFVAGYGFALALAGVAFTGCMAEWTPAVEAWLRAWQRCVGGTRWRRTLAYGTLLVFVGFALGVTLVLVVSAVTGFFPNSSVATAVVAQVSLSLLSFVYFVFQYAWFVAYYFDLRVRSEGLDLAMQSDSLDGLRAAAAAK